MEHKETKDVPPSNNDKISVIFINDIIDKPISKFTEKVKDTYGFSGNAGITTTTMTTMTTTSQYS